MAVPGAGAEQARILARSKCCVRSGFWAVSTLESETKSTPLMFAVGERVDVVGTSKGRGFAGVMKRHGFHGGQRTHGQSDRLRAPGSIGPGTTPGRVLKGTRMAGRMGTDRVTIKELEVVQSDAERNMLLIKGSVPGPNGGLLLIRKGTQQMALASQSGAENSPQQRG